MQLPLNNGDALNGLTLRSAADEIISQVKIKRENQSINYVTVGLALLLLYLAQQWFDLRWELLQTLQHEDSFKKNSGLVLGGFMILQWSLTWVRVLKMKDEVNKLFISIHKWLGAFSPLFFYAHAMEFGYAYLFFLTCLFVTNMLVGYLNPEKIGVTLKAYLQGWMIVHVTLSVLLTLLMFFHGFMAYYYN